MDQSNKQSEKRYQQHQDIHQLRIGQQQRHPLGSSSSSSCSSSCGSKNPHISSNPAFKYFQEQLTRGGQDHHQLSTQQSEVAKKSEVVGREEGDTGSDTSVKLFSTMPKKSSQSTSCDDFLKSGNKNSNKIRIISNSSNDMNNNKSNSNDSSNDKAKVNVAKLIKRHHDEIQSSNNNQFKRSSGSDRYKWFFRSLRGERAHKSADETSGLESNAGIREVECSRCRLASLTTNQLEENIVKLQNSLAEKTAQLESLSRSLVDRDEKLKDMETKFNRLSMENIELKGSIHRIISEQMFGRRLLMNSETHQNSLGEGRQFNANKLHHTSSLGVKGKPSCLSQPSLTLMVDLNNGNSRGSNNTNGFVNSNRHHGHHRLFSPIRSSGDDEDFNDEPGCHDDDNNDDDGAGVSIPLGKSMSYHPAIKAKPSINLSTHPSPSHSVHPKNRRLRELLLSDREWHSSEGFDDVAMSTVGTATEVGDGRRSAKSSLELDDSLCVEYPNRTFRQQMECLRGVAKSVESLKSDPADQKFKARRRRGTVTNPERDVDSTLYPSNNISSNNINYNNFTISRTRKLSNYKSQIEQQNRKNDLDRDCFSEAASTKETAESRIFRTNSSDHLTHPPSPPHQKITEQQYKQLPDIDPRDYNLNNKRNDHGAITHGNQTNQNNNTADIKARHNSSDHGPVEDKQIYQLRDTIERLERQMIKDHETWLNEKMRVIEYQKKLQDAYLQVAGQCKRMENELRQLRSVT